MGAVVSQLRRRHAIVPAALATLFLLARCSADTPPASTDATGVSRAALDGTVAAPVSAQAMPNTQAAVVEWSSIPDSSWDSGLFELSPLAVSPGVSTSFVGPAWTGSYPPDEGGAVGPNHVVTVANGVFYIQSRAGALTSTKTLNAFWDPALGMNKDAIHSRVLYDPYGARWIVASRGSLGVTTTDPSDGSTSTDYTYFILLAVSQTNDPTGLWNQYKVQVDDGSYDPNYMVLGFNKTWIAAGINLSVTVPIFGTLYGGSPIFLFDKSAVYAGSTVTPKKLSRSDGIRYQLVPATTLDANESNLYVMQVKSDSAAAVRLFKVSGAIGSETLTEVTSTNLTAPTAWAGTGNDLAPQLGTSTKIYTHDSRISSVVFRNGSVWAAHTVFYPSSTPTRSAVQWWQISPGATASVVQRGVIDDTSGAKFYAYPSLVVNKDNDMMIGFSRFSSTQYASANYALRTSSDAAGTLRDDVVLKAGEGTYSRVPFFGSNYWGEHSSTVIDPTDDTGMWTLQEYAATSNRWGLWWGRVKITIPVLTSPGNKTVAEGSNLTFTLSATDAGGEALTYSGSNLPSGATVNPTTGVFSWTPTYYQAGIYDVTFVATDSTSLSDSKTIRITVTNVYDPPALASIGPKSGAEGSPLSFTISATDPQSMSINYSATNLPSGASFNSGTRTFSWTPGYTQAGTYNVTFTAANTIPLSSSEVVTITIANTNRAPSLAAVSPVTAAEGAAISFTLSGTDPDGDSVTYSGSNLPSGASVNPTTGAFAWTPGYDQAGSYVLTFVVTDAAGLSGSASATFTITNTNRAPVFTNMASRSGAEAAQLSFTVAVDDPDGDTFTLTPTGLPPGATFNAVSRRFTWTPDYGDAGTYQIGWTATDSGGLSTVQVTTITIAKTNRAPSLTPISSQNGVEGTPISITLSAIDPDGDSITYSATGLPSGASIGASSGKFTWTPTYTQAGTYQVTFAAIDSGGLQDVLTVLFTIANLNRAPKLNTFLPPDVMEGETMAFTISGSDPDSDPLTYLASGLPEGAVLNPNTGAFSWVPQAGQYGSYQVTFSVSDGALMDSLAVTLTVNTLNHRPVLKPQPDITIAAGRTITFTVSATDQDGDQLVYALSPLPFGSQFDPNIGRFVWPTDEAQVGVYPLTLKASDPPGLSATGQMTITLVTNNPPVLAGIGPKNGAEGSALSFKVIATDEEGDALTYSATNLPPGSTFDPATATFTWTPSYTQAGVTKPTFTVSDGLDSASETVTITIANTNRAPVLTAIGAKSGAEGVLLTFKLSATDPDGDALQFAATDLPAGATFDPATAVFTWTPGYDQEGLYELGILVTDGDLSAEERVLVSIANSNRPPVFNATAAQLGKEGSALTFTVSALDPEGDAITYSASNLPKGASFDEATRTFDWTPDYDQSGTYTVAFNATDAGGATGTQNVTITVAETNRLPIWNALLDQAGAEGTFITFTAVATDPDGDAVTYSLTDAPTGASIGATTGIFTWMPAFNQAGTVTVTFHATDVHNGDATTAVTFTITNTNQAPMFTPMETQRGAEGQALGFTVTAVDPDGDALTFSAGNLPTGATLNAATGEFLWTPTYEQAGTYSVTVEAEDPSGLKASAPVSIVIATTNRPPALEPIAPQTARRGAKLTVTALGADPDGDVITWSAQDLPKEATFNATTQTFEWTPRADAPEHVVVKISASDGKLSATTNLDITVTNGQAPQIEPIAEVTVAVGEAVELTVKASDPDGDFVFLTAESVPPTANFDRLTGRFTWTPAAAHVGQHTVHFTAKDASGNSATADAVINVVQSGKAKGGCGCSTGFDASGLLLLGAVVVLKRRRGRA
jgi:hypothetical protein